MNLLTEGIANHVVEETGRSAKVTIDGTTRNEPIYRIRLDQLFYNDRNGRIATYLSKYKADHNLKEINRSNLEEYNSIIHDFITKRNPADIKQTQNNIEMFTQKQHGIVLKDGRIIDGNRRFTCLRNLAKEKGDKWNWLEAVILDRDYETDEKQIKLLEIEVQIGEEEKVPYPPIDNLAAIYESIIENKIITPEEYARSAHMSVQKVKEQVECAELLVEFLEAINAPKQYFIAQELELYTPIDELRKVLKKQSDEDTKARLKSTAFVAFITKPDRDMKYYIRDVNKIVNSGSGEEYLDATEEAVEDTLERLNEKDVVTPEDIAHERNNTETREKLSKVHEKFNNKIKFSATKQRPAQLVEDAIDNIKDIDTFIFTVLDEEERNNLKVLLDKLADEVQKLRSGFPEE